MSCGARLPVYVLFIGAFFPSEKARNYLFGIYILGAILGLFAAKFLRMTAFRGLDEPFVMEMPKYRMPNWHLVGLWFIIKPKCILKKQELSYFWPLYLYGLLAILQKVKKI
ncbi:ferrous iron transport protein B [Campylobacter jejuni subsp. doylei]|nr:ferrous iron transport protein B [Campylobacter jejuni subsp. doylei]